MTQATSAQIARITKDWHKLAGENVVVEQTGGALYGFCSELGALRLCMKYRTLETARVAFSENLGSWFFSFDLR